MFPPVPCEGQEHVVCQRVRRVHQLLLWGILFLAFLLGFLASSWCLVHMGSAGFASLPCCVQGLGYTDVPPAGHALWAEVGVGITFVTSGRNA